MSKREDFNYHYRCNHLKLNYLIFVDDLMLFYKGEVNSIVLMVGVQKLFQMLLGCLQKKRKMPFILAMLKMRLNKGLCK